MDIHNHTTGDCWLKHQSGWDGDTDRKTTNLVRLLMVEPDFSTAYAKSFQNTGTDLAS